MVSSGASTSVAGAQENATLFASGMSMAEINARQGQRAHRRIHNLSHVVGLPEAKVDAYANAARAAFKRTMKAIKAAGG